MNFAMLSRVFLLGPVLLMTSLWAADSAKPKAADDAQKQPKVSNPDLQKLADNVNGSYYHPDRLPGLQCTVAIDWSGLYNALKVKVPPERLHAIEGVQIHSKALRNKPPEITFSWLNGAPDTKDQLEDGTRQMIGGLYQWYWSMMASPPLLKTSDNFRLEPQPDGTAKLYESDPNNKIVVDLDKNDAPTRYAFDTPAFKGTFDFTYVDSPAPARGDLRRVSSVHVVSNFGASSFNVGLDFDYQQVDGYFVPKHVTYNLIGAYSISMEFIACSTTEAPLGDTPQ